MFSFLSNPLIRIQSSNLIIILYSCYVSLPPCLQTLTLFSVSMYSTARDKSFVSARHPLFCFQIFSLSDFLSRVLSYDQWKRSAAGILDRILLHASCGKKAFCLCFFFPLGILVRGCDAWI